MLKFEWFEGPSVHHLGHLSFQGVVQWIGHLLALSQVLKLTADASQESSYSAFLAACLFQHHSNLEEAGHTGRL